MIGQINLINNINNLVDTNKLPHFIIVSGCKGQGKSTIIQYISDKLGATLINIEPKIDYIRNLKELALKSSTLVLFSINNADELSNQASNSLLKIAEECPQNVYIILELNDINNTLETIRSRCQEFKMENYTKEELKRLIDLTHEPLGETEDILLDICQNKYQIDLMIKYGVKEFYKFVEKVVDNIYKVQSANAFKLEEKLDIKGDGNGYDLDLFFNTFNNICFDKAWEIVGIDSKQEEHNKYINSIIKTTEYKNKLNIKGINKLSLLDNWIIAIRKIWR